MNSEKINFEINYDYFQKFWHEAPMISKVTLARTIERELTALADSLITSFPLYFSISSEQALIAFVRTEIPWFWAVRNKTINRRKHNKHQEKKYNNKAKIEDIKAYRNSILHFGTIL